MKGIESLRENQEIVLSLATAFGVIVPSLALAWLPELSPNALRKLLRRLVKARLLMRYTYGEGEFYFVLSRRAVRLLNLPNRRVGPLGWPGLIQAVGVLGACVHAGLDKLSAAEFSSLFPDLATRRGMQTSYYALTPEDGLAWIIVDHGAAPFTTVKKIQKIAAQRYQLPAFRELLLENGLSVFVATATPEKAADLEAALDKNPPRYIRVQVVVVPQLLSLVFQKGTKK